MKKILFFGFIAVLMSLSCLTGCRVGSEELDTAVRIKVVATEDFGKIPIFEREAEINRRMSAQDVLAEVTEFETDGSYILEFEGRRGNDKVYWMYYVNGLLSKYFAGGYIIRPGDVMHWDFHTWAGAHHGSSAIIGAFPEPMLHGYEGNVYPTVIVYGENYREEAEDISEGLQALGVTDIYIVSETAVTESQRANNNIVLVADGASEMIADLNAKYEPLGMYTHFEDGEIVLTDYQFTEQQRFGEGTGIVQACQNLWNPLGTGSCHSAVFIVSGMDASGVEKAAGVLLDCVEAIRNEETSEIEGAYGVLISEDGTIIRTPY